MPDPNVNDPKVILEKIDSQLQTGSAGSFALELYKYFNAPSSNIDESEIGMLANLVSTESKDPGNYKLFFYPNAFHDRSETELTFQKLDYEVRAQPTSSLDEINKLIDSLLPPRNETHPSTLQQLDKIRRDSDVGKILMPVVSDLYNTSFLGYTYELATRECNTTEKVKYGEMYMSPEGEVNIRFLIHNDVTGEDRFDTKSEYRASLLIQSNVIPPQKDVEFSLT